MKRSMAVPLVLLGSAAVGLPGCKPKTESYANIDACKTSGKHSEKECSEAFTQAMHEHQQSAPQFSSREECATASGVAGCEERHLASGATVFLPLMLGFALQSGIGYRPLYQYPGRKDCLFTRDGGRYGDCSSGGSGGGGGHGGWFHGGGSSSGSTGDSGTAARGGFGEAGHAASGGHGGGGGE